MIGKLNLFILVWCWLYRTPWIIAQYRSMPINTDQNHNIDPNYSQCRSLSITSVEKNWSTLIFIDRHGVSNAILISIDQHWLALCIDRGSPDYEATSGGPHGFLTSSLKKVFSFVSILLLWFCTVCIWGPKFGIFQGPIIFLDSLKSNIWEEWLFYMLIN